MYVDPVLRAEREIEELIALHNQDTQEGEPAVESVDTSTETHTDQGELEPVETPAPQPVEDPNSDSYKARWETLQGKYSAETRRQQDEIRRLQAELEQAKAKPEQPEEKPATVEEALDDLETEYGEAFTRAIDRRIDKRIDDRLEKKLKPVQDQLQKYQAENQQSAEERYWSTVSRLCPNFQVLNTDPEFLKWLSANKIGRRTYQELLNDAHAAGDAVGVADIFNKYQPSKPVKPATPSPDELIVPKRGGSGDHARIENAQGQTITMAEVDQFYKDLTLGRIKPEDAAKREAEIMKAMKENRIVG